jgi:predicted dehydrogenase|tara:strand:+ start:418 stop:1407 length:990 start_codon:yes stop_codon:yes gene_type:complete
MKVLIVGLGSIGKRHLKNILSTTDCEIIVYSKHTNLKSSVKKNVKIFNTLDACLSEKPDVAFITNETAYHIPIAKKLAKAGLDLFIEKPLSNTIENVNELSKIVEKKKTVTLIGCNLRFDSCIRKIKSLIEQKVVGKIISVKVECGTYLPDWHPDENYTNSYAARDDLGGGVVLTCIHELDYLYWFFGKVKEVFSVTGQFSNLKIDTSDLSATILKFQSDIIAEVHLDYFQKPEIRSCKIIGTKGTIYWDSLTNEVKVYDFLKTKWTSKLKIKKYQKNEMYVKELKHFIQCVNRKEKSINDLSQGNYLLKVALEIIKSSKLKKSIIIKK